MPTPKTLQMFMMDGTPDGPIKASIANWVGRVYSIPRTEINSAKLKQRPDLNQPAVYFLVGTNPDTDQPKIYIGQATRRQNGMAFARAAEHTRSDDKDFFNRIIYLVVVDNSWGPTEITFLENAFHQRAVSAGRYEVANGNTPSPGKVTEEVQAVLDEFIENTNLIISALGITAFQPVASEATRRGQAAVPQEHAPSSADDEPVFELASYDRSIHALGQRTPGGFVVFSGAKLREDLTASAPKAITANRERYADSMDNFRLTKDVEFSSPSSAASFVRGAATNGRTAWHLAENANVSLADWEDRETDEVEAEGMGDGGASISG